jgi:glycerate dehydrogenase
MPKIVILDGYTENPGDLSWSGFEVLGELTVYDRTAPDQVVSRIGDANIVYTNKTPITRETLETCPKIEFIGVLATGYNVVDYEFAKAKNIPVANIPTYGTAAVAQFAFALILEVCHHVGHHSQEVSRGKWTANPDWCFWDYPLIELAGKTIGIVGFGRIGQAVARIAKALDMDVLAFDEYLNETGKKLARYVGLDELYEKSDVISLHVPLFPSTNGMINAASIAKMKESVIIVNTSRGPLVNEADLQTALNTGRIAAYAADVVSCEPIRADNPLLSAKNCIITPHIAWASKESRGRLMDIAVNNLANFFDGTPINIVNR